MLVEYSFPPEVQKWIVGKRIAADSDTLAKCGVKTSGTVMFLYLISPKSVGLSKQKIMLKYKHLLPQGRFQQDVTQFLGQRRKQTEPELLFSCHLKLTSNGDLSIVAVLLQEIRHNRASSKVQRRQQPQRRMNRLQEHLQRQTLVQPVILKSEWPRLLQLPLRAPPLQLLQRNRQRNLRRRGHLPSNQSQSKRFVWILHSIFRFFKLAATPGVANSDAVFQVGWACTVCTFFNVPTRPGCAMCSQPRPADYKVPEGYVIPQVELDRMAAEAEAERLAREVSSLVLADASVDGKCGLGVTRHCNLFSVDLTSGYFLLKRGEMCFVSRPL